MEKGERTYCCIDLKSFYASVECVERGLDPLTARLVVADRERGPKTICLAVSPAMKALGAKGRPRVFQLPRGVTYEMARPRMSLYLSYSARIVGIYLRYIDPQDLHVYSIDECFMDLTPYLSLYGKTARELVGMLCDEVLCETGLTATAGIGSNLFLAKVALDVTAKHAADGVGVLDERSFREQVWHHRPLTDIWQIGGRIAARLRAWGIYDLYDLAHADVDALYHEFGVNAEYLIDHAWGLEPCTIAEIHAYEPQATSIGSGQVLPCDYTFEEGRMILREMVDEVVLELVEKRLVAGHVGLHVGYASQKDAPDHASASRKLEGHTASFEKVMAFMDSLFCEMVDPDRAIKRINVSLGHLMPEQHAACDLFTDQEAEAQERARQEALVAIKQRFGKDAVMRGTSLKEKARGRERAHQVGGHHA